ncbi:hypothetical protein VB780_03260 [Leptolyngbya sp. CCNP1308]|uniref:hypothetical protein n=1 Tax=Leptolyngbya sp. CCNP1308 TaxID=3110255 RepID=UPI002B212D22|nr:hypothetical protein [Leptolyngbya sp. CCNP1308]MEA5447572.1 hypothetical protein [Leptolyngbya sp. CCNP1308]
MKQVIITTSSVYLNNGNRELTLTLEQLKAVEPDFEILEGFVEVQTNQIHYVIDAVTHSQSAPPEGRQSIMSLYGKIDVYEQALGLEPPDEEAPIVVDPNQPDWLQLIQDVNLGPVLMPWMLANATPNHFAYLLAVVNNRHREPWMLYAALNLIFTEDTNIDILGELVDVLDRNNFDSNQLTFLQGVGQND